MSGDAYLISKSFAMDSIGNQVATETQVPIPIEIGSITRSEFFQAGEQKLNPEMVVTTAAINYNGEEVIIIEQVRYSIYRKFRPDDSDDIELYLRKEVGNV